MNSLGIARVTPSQVTRKMTPVNQNVKRPAPQAAQPVIININNYTGGGQGMPKQTISRPSPKQPINRPTPAKSTFLKPVKRTVAPTARPRVLANPATKRPMPTMVASSDVTKSKLNGWFNSNRINKAAKFAAFGPAGLAFRGAKSLLKRRKK